MKFSFLDPPLKEVREVRPARALPRGQDDEKTSSCAKLVEGLGLFDLANRLEVRWNSRMRSNAGRATWPSALIELNPRLVEISQEEVRRTMLHELAHLVTYERWGNRRIQAHGPQWRKACRDLGIPNESATHQLSLPSRTMKRQWRYACPVCERTFERVRRFKGRVACYTCCKEVNGGAYHEAFQLREFKLSE